MYLMDSHNQMSHIEFWLWLQQGIPLDKEIHEIPSRQVLKHKIKEKSVLEAWFQLNNVLCFGSTENLLLKIDMIDLVSFNHLVFMQSFDCYQLICITMCVLEDLWRQRPTSPKDPLPIMASN